MGASTSAADRAQDEASLRPGDLLRFPRGRLYSHWAVYLGRLEDGRPVVGHLWSPPAKAPGDEAPRAARRPPGGPEDPGNSVRGRPAVRDGLLNGKMNTVILSPLEEVGDEWYVANKQYDTRFSDPLPREEIVERVCRRIGERSYSLLFHNCEHFATWARYDQTASDQVALITDLVCGTAAVVVGSAAGVAGSLIGNVTSAALASATVGTAARLARSSKRRQIRRQGRLLGDGDAHDAEPAFRMESSHIRKIVRKPRRPDRLRGVLVDVPSAATAAAAALARKLKDNQIKTAAFCSTVGNALSTTVKDKLFFGQQQQHEQRRLAAN